MDVAIDHATFAATFLSEMLVEGFRASASSRPLVPVLPTTDCRSLYDCLQKLCPSLTEKRVLIDIAAIRESCTATGADSCPVRWVPTLHQLADAFTKRCRQLRDRIRCFALRPEVTLVAPTG